MTYFHDLREDVRDGAHAPDLDAIHRTARRRRQTRLSVTAAAAAVVVVAGTYAVAHPRPQTASHAGPVRGPISSTAVPITKSMKMLSLFPLDTQTTYAVAKTASGGYAILRTTDGGGAWKAWTLPDEVRAKIDPTTFTHDVKAPKDILDLFKEPIFLTGLSFTVNGYLTRDGGESWRRIRTTEPAKPGRPAIAVGAPVAAIPAGWRLGYAQLGGEKVRLAAVDPATATWHELVTQPPAFSSLQVSPDGTIWTSTILQQASSQNGKHYMTGLAVSHDRGRTWRSFTLPQVGEDAGPVVGLDGEHALADVMVEGGPQAGGLKHAYTLVTDDGGRTWTKRTNDRSMPLVGHVLPDGSVLGYNNADTACSSDATPSGLIVTRDLGKTCTTVDGTEKPGRLAHTVNDAYVLSNQNLNPTGYRISTDGIHWEPAPMPPIG